MSLILFSIDQEISRIPWNPKAHDRIHYNTPSVPILNQLNPVQTTISHCLKSLLSIFLPSTPQSPKWSHSTRFPQNILYMYLLSPIRASCPPISLFSILSPEIFGSELRIIKLLFIQFPSHPSYLDPFWPKYSINTVFPNILNIDSSLNVSHQFSYPYKTTGKLVFYVLIFTFLESTLKGNSFCID
jgi:hypothetical protein